MTTTASREEQALRALLAGYAQQPTGADFAPEQKQLLRGLAREKVVVLLAFPLKCGGTFLREVLRIALGLAGGHGMAAGLLRGSFLGVGDGERDLYLPNLLSHFQRPAAIPSSCTPTPTRTSRTAAW